MNEKIDVRGILERAGADADAPEGSQAWALARVDAVVTNLIEASSRVIRAFEAYGKANGLVAARRCRLECEAAMVSQKAALSNIRSAS